MFAAQPTTNYNVQQQPQQMGMTCKAHTISQPPMMATNIIRDRA